MDGRPVRRRRVARREVEQRTVVVRSAKEKRPLARVSCAACRRLARGAAAALPGHRARADACASQMRASHRIQHTRDTQHSYRS
jgi:hypothetical protein